MMQGKKTLVAILASLFLLVLIGCHKRNTPSAKSASSSLPQAAGGGLAENPVSPEKNPPGDIPDTQVFVKYTSTPGGYELAVPEGWARTTSGSDVAFAFHFDGLSVSVTSAPRPPSVDGIRAEQAENLKKTGRAVTIKDIKKGEPSGTAAVHVVYESNSEPDPITNKQVRLENESYFFFNNGKLAVLRLWAPLGADNVDQWRQISSSFKWM
jgi:hypothetical protein